MKRRDDLPARRERARCAGRPGPCSARDGNEWIEQSGSAAFATCPITENGLLRILGHPRYPNSPGTPAAAGVTLAALRGLPGHHFWADKISLMDAERIDMTRLLSHGQVTDSYLLALAKAHGGRLASLDKNWWWALSRVASKRLS